MEQTSKKHIKETRACQQCHIQWMHLCAEKLGVDMSQLLTPPRCADASASDNANLDQQASMNDS